MGVLTHKETRIRELHEDDTAVERRLDDATARALETHERIVADGRLDQRDVPDLLDLLRLVPAIRADAAASLRYNRTINRHYCELASERRQWSLRESRDVELEEAA